jgi:hypothetical protein
LTPIYSDMPIPETMEKMQHLELENTVLRPRARRTPPPPAGLRPST